MQEDRDQESVLIRFYFIQALLQKEPGIWDFCHLNYSQWIGSKSSFQVFIDIVIYSAS